MIDRLQYELFNFLWSWWHMWLRRWWDKRAGRPYSFDSRPWYELCCNGDAGGWRTAFCDWLEQKWRFTRYYSEH